MLKNLQLTLHKIIHWEYWPAKLVQIPIFFVWFYYGIKARSLFFFNASNPSIPNGGLLMESKMKVYQIIPQQYIPKTILIEKDTPTKNIEEIFKNSEINFPCIVKPDIGSRGRGVEKLESVQSILEYAKNINRHFLIQEFVNYKNEVGIFYCRMPDQNNGFISGIVLKEFIKINGDGISNVEQLLKQNPRYHLQLNDLKTIYGDKLKTILAQNEELSLAAFGNHARGAKFIDISHKADAQLNKAVDKICKQIPHFYFGRLDLRYNSFEELKRGEKISIIELNGAGSDPTHIYDPAHSIFYGWKETARHISLLYKVSVKNHKLGHQYLSFSQGIKMLKDHIQYSTALSKYKYMEG